MRNISRTVLWLALVSLLLVAGAGQVALADSSVHRIIWTSGSNSTINADKDQMVSNPTANYTTEHVMDLNFSFTGNADRYQAEIRFPAYLFYDRDGNPITTIPGPDNKPISTVEVPLPQYDPANPTVSEPPEAATKFNWRIENNEVILSNYLPIKDNFFVTLQIKYRVQPYLVKNGYTNTINAAMTVNTLSGQTETYTSNDLAITYNTKADLYSFSKSAGTADSFRT